MPLKPKIRYSKAPRSVKHTPGTNCYIDWLQRGYAAFRRRRSSQQSHVTTRFGLWSALAVSTISVGFLALGVWELPEEQSYNLMHKARRELTGAPHWDEDVVIIAMDEASVKRKGFLPWNRDRHADLLHVLQAGQPAAVVFDLFFPDETPQDERFVDAIVSSGNVVLGVAQRETYLDVSPSISQSAEGYFLKGDMGSDHDADGITRRLPLVGHQGVPSIAVAALQVAAQTLSSTVTATEVTTTEREMSQPFDAPFDTPFDAETYTALASRSDRAAGEGQASVENGTRLAITSAQMGVDTPEKLLDKLLPKHSPVWLSWPGETATAKSPVGPGTLPVYSYIDVVEGRVNPSRLRNKIVLVGATAMGSDQMRSPFTVNHTVSGVHLFAAAINNLLNQSYLRRTPKWQCAFLIVGLSLATGYILRRQGVYQRLATVLTFPMAWMGFAIAAFYGGWWIPVAAPIGTVMLGALAVQLYEQQEKQQLMALFSMNVSSGTAQLIWRHKGAILDHGELEAQTLTATVLFMDIRGFTSIAQTLPSQKLLPWLNQYFETMTDCIMKHGGMVDKYIGDAIMAVFGAPLPRTQPEEIQDDAIAALHAAIEMHQRLRELNRNLTKQNLPTIEFGIGIHTGPLIGGTVGNKHRLNYSLFGDTVNIAARLETLTKALPKDTPFNILLSDNTRELTGAYFPMQPFQSCQLQGRQGLTDVYMIAAPHPPSNPPSDSRREGTYRLAPLNQYSTLEAATYNS